MDDRREMRSVLVTGGAGFIGSHLVERLLGTGEHAVTVVDDFNTFYDPALKRANVAAIARHPHATLIESDILDRSIVRDAFARARFDTVIHLAARAGVRPSVEDPLLYQRVNVEGTYSMLECAREFGVKKFVFASSSSVYGARSQVPFSESDPINSPASPYAATKIAGEAACHSYAHLFGIQCVCLRFFTAYGPRQRPDLAIRKFTELIAAGRPVPLFGDGSSARDYTYVDDVVEGIVRAAAYDATPFEVLNLGGERPVRLVKLVELISGALGAEPEIEWLPDQPGDVPITCADGEKAKRLLGFSPSIEIADGIAKFVDWFRAERRLGPRSAAVEPTESAARQ